MRFDLNPRQRLSKLFTRAEPLSSGFSGVHAHRVVVVMVFLNTVILRLLESLDQDVEDTF